MVDNRTLKYIEAQDLPEGEKVYLRRDWLGWKQVYPVKQDGKFNYMNLLFGGKRNLIFLILLIILVSLIYLGVQELNSGLKEIAEDPCSYCFLNQPTTTSPFPNLQPLNISQVGDLN